MMKLSSGSGLGDIRGSRHAPLNGGAGGQTVASGFKGRDSPLIVIHRRNGDAHSIRIGLASMALSGVLGAGTPFMSMGVGRVKSPDEWVSTGDTVGGVEGLNACTAPQAGGDATGNAPAGSPCRDGNA